MKIGLITKDFAPIRGGAERYGYNLAHSLAAKKHEVHVFCRNFEEKLAEGIIAHPISSATDCINTTHCDVVYALTPHFPTDAYRAGDGVHLHWLQLKYPNPILRFGARIMPGKMKKCRIERELYTNPGKCAHIIANSNLVKQHIINYYNTPSERIHVVHNGVDSKFFHPGLRTQKQEWLLKHSVDPTTLTILFIANNWKRKGLGTLIQGAKTLLQQKKAWLVVVGKGKEKKWKPLLQKEKIIRRVSFIKATKQVVQWYCAADIMVLPTRYDPFANVCLESMSCATPIITTSENGASEIIQQGINGYTLSDPHDHEQLAHYLKLSQDKNHLISMGEKARETAMQCSIDKNATETLAILSKIGTQHTQK